MLLLCPRHAAARDRIFPVEFLLFGSKPAGFLMSPQLPRSHIPENLRRSVRPPFDRKGT